MDNKAVLEFAVTTGERMLANGCGTHRIEGLINKILKNCEFKNHEIFVTTTGIVVTVAVSYTHLDVYKRQVLHEDAIFPVRIAGIPINIRNTNRPNDRGTMIVKSADNAANDNIITGVAGKKGFSTIVLEKDMMNSEIGFGKKVLEVLMNNNVSFEHLPSGIDAMSIIVSTEDVKDKRLVLADEITKACLLYTSRCV